MAWLAMFVGMLLAGCACNKSETKHTPKSQSQYSWAYDPFDPDKYEPSLPLDPYFPPKPVSENYQAQ